MKLKWKRQGSKRNCGQIAVSVVAGKSLKEIYKIIGHDSGTDTWELARALRKLGFRCPSRLRRMKQRPQLAIAKLHAPYMKSHWHWVVVHGDRIYDGVWGTSAGTVKWKRGLRITSYLPIKCASGENII